MKEEIHTSDAPVAIGPYAQAIRSGNLLFCSGQIALSPTSGELISGSVAEQTVQVLSNLNAVLSKAGATKDMIVRTDIFLSNIDDFPLVNGEYELWLDGESAKPARQTVGGVALPKGALVEISCIAHLTTE